MYLWYNPAEVLQVLGNTRRRNEPSPYGTQTVNSKSSMIGNVQQRNQTYTWRSG